MKTKGMALILAALTILLTTGMVSAQGTAPVAGQKKFPLLEKLEARLGRALTTGERQQIGAASRDLITRLKALQDDFAVQVAGQLGCQAEEVKELLPKVGESREGAATGFVTRLEEKLGRKLSAQDKQLLLSTFNEKKAAAAPDQAAFADKVSKITGIPAQEITGFMTQAGGGRNR
ncbi:MAG: hypothetical protein RDV48_15855 [Candidatus Eremiobacteraeota bacterium]|nr:hypothetical protein [Candidatus Eremiobacteraeota bacterium]